MTLNFPLDKIIQHPFYILIEVKYLFSLQRAIRLKISPKYANICNYNRQI